jgi:hypothetical protein
MESNEMPFGPVPDEVLLEEAVEFALRALAGEPLPKNYTDPIGRWFKEQLALRRSAA